MSSSSTTTTSSATAPDIELVRKLINEAIKKLGEGVEALGKPNPDPDPDPNPNPNPGPIGGEIQDKGANPDPHTWKSAKMQGKEYKGMWKVVDNKGINVAHKFTSQANADAFIADVISKLPPPPPPPVDHHCEAGFHWDDREQKCVEDSPNPDPNPVPTGNVDKFGVQILSGESTGNINYTYRNNDRKDGKRMDFQNKGKDTNKNSEVTGYFAFKKNNAPADEVSGKFSVMPHSDGNHVQCIDMGVDIKSGASRWRFEDPHPTYTGTLDTGKTKGIALADKFVGYKFSRVDIAGGSKQRLRIWQDQGDNEGDKPANKWVLLFDVVNDKHPVNSYPDGAQVTIRVDGSNVVKDMSVKWVSNAEVKPQA